MRAALALPLLAAALAGCTGMEEYDPMAMACQDERVQQAGWCDGSFGGPPPATGGAKASAAPAEGGVAKVQLTEQGAVWTYRAEGEHERKSFAWDSPGKARLTWRSAGSGGIRVAVQAAGGTLYDSDPGQAGDSALLAGREGAWTVTIDVDNFAGEARVELAAA